MFEQSQTRETREPQEKNRISQVIHRIDLAEHVKPNLHPVPFREFKQKNVGQVRLLTAAALETSLREAIDRALADHKDELLRLRAMERRHADALIAAQALPDMQARAERAEAEATALAQALERSKADLMAVRLEAEAARREAETAVADAKSAAAVAADEIARLTLALEAKEALASLQSGDGAAPVQPLARIAGPGLPGEETATSRDETREMLTKPGVFDAPTEIMTAVVAAVTAAPAPASEAPIAEAAFASEATSAPEAISDEPSFSETLFEEPMFDEARGPAPVVDVVAVASPELAVEEADASAFEAPAAPLVAEAPVLDATPSVDEIAFESSEEEEMLLAVLDDESDEDADLAPITDASTGAVIDPTETSDAIDRIFAAAFEMPVDLPGVATSIAEAPVVETSVAEAAVVEDTVVEAPAVEVAAPALAEEAPAAPEASIAEVPQAEFAAPVTESAPVAAEALAVEQAPALESPVEAHAETAPSSEEAVTSLPALVVGTLIPEPAAEIAEVAATPEVVADATPVEVAASEPVAAAEAVAAATPESIVEVAALEPAPEAAAPAPSPEPIVAAPAPAPVPARLGSPRPKLAPDALPKAAFFGFGGSAGFGAQSWKKPARDVSGKAKRG